MPSFIQKCIDFFAYLIAGIFARPAYDEDPATLPMNQDPIAPAPRTPPALLWDTPEHVRHSIRVKCDRAGFDLARKNRLTACIYQESEFIPTAKGKPNTDGTRDWGLCQYNDGRNAKGQAYWIGPGAAFASVEEVLQNPEKNVDIMIEEEKAGRLGHWASYSTGAYAKWMPHVATAVPAIGHY